MADLSISIGINARQTKKGADEAKRSLKGVGDEAEKTGKKSKNAADRDISGLNTQLGGLSKIGGLASIGVAAVGAAILGAAAAAAKAAEVIFQLAKSFAGLGKEIGDAQALTGLSAKTLSALKFQVESTGGSFDSFKGNLKDFAKTIGDANNGSKDASAKLNRLGIDAKKAATDMDGSLRSALNTILSLPPGIERTNRMIDAFGEDIEKLAPVLNTFRGGLDGVIQGAEDLGVTLSEDDVRAAAEFNKALAEVQAMLRSVGITFGRELLPVVRDVLRDIGQWLSENKGEIKSWAETIAFHVQAAVDAFKDVRDQLKNVRDAFDLSLSTEETGRRAAQREVERQNRLNELLRGQRKRDYLNSLPPVGPVDPNVQNSAATTLGPGFDAFLREKRQARNRQATGGGRIAKEVRAALTPIQEMEKALKNAQAAYDLLANNGEAQRLRLETDKLREQQSVLEELLKLRAARNILDAKIPATLEGLQKEVDLINLAITAEERRKQLKKDFVIEKSRITNESFTTNVGLGVEMKVVEEQIRLGRELTAVEQFRQEIAGQRLIYERELQLYGYSPEQISMLLAIKDGEAERTEEIIESTQASRERFAAEQAYKNLIGGLDSEILDLTIQLQEYTTGIETSRVAILQLTEAYKKLTPEQQKAATQKAAESDALRESIKAQQEARQAYDEMYGTIRDSLQVLSEQGFGAFFKNVYRKFKDFLLDMVTEWLTSKFFQMFFKGGNQAAGQASGQGGGIFGGILNGIFGGGNLQGQGPGGTPLFNFAGGGTGSNMNGGGSGGIGSIFGGEGGLFGPRKNLLTGKDSKLAGILGGIGSIATIAGGAIGGRGGGILSGAGMGMSIGASFGPWGALIGGAIGFFAGLFGGDPKRKRDKNEKLPALNKGFTDALKELRDLVGDVRTLRVSPDSAIARATELRNQIASGFGLEFESKKYRKQARTLISQRTREADALLAELRNAAEIANAAGERQRRLIPEFATGVFMSRDFTKQLGDFKRMNGMMAGRYTGIDTINARIGAGEMVLNPRQQQNVRSNAGLDPFRNAGIPGYAGGGAVGGGQSASGSSPEPMNMTFVFEHSIDAAGMVRTSLKNSPDVKREVRVVVEDLAENDRLKLQRRGL